MADSKKKRDRGRERCSGPFSEWSCGNRRDLDRSANVGNEDNKCVLITAVDQSESDECFSRGVTKDFTVKIYGPTLKHLY